MKENVLRGVALLDEKVPDWRERINPDRLSMVSCNSCILGQLFGNYFEGARMLGIYGSDYGFNVSGEDTYLRLRQLWKEQL